MEEEIIDKLDLILKNQQGFITSFSIVCFSVGFILGDIIIRWVQN